MNLLGYYKKDKKSLSVVLAERLFLVALFN